MNTQFQSGITLTQARKDAKKLVKSEGLPLNKALDSIAEQHHGQSWSKSVRSLKVNIEPLARDSDGYGVHSLIPDSDEEYIDLSKLSAFRGRKISRVSFEDDAPESLVTRFYEKDDADISEWIPTPPEPNAILIAVSDTDDGPYAWFVSDEANHVIDSSIGQLAIKYSGLSLPIQVCESGAGFYVGTQNDTGPVSRESAEYFSNEEEAINAIKYHSWTQRQEP